jgi:hypothetical protein
MCAKCDEIDQKVERHRFLASRISDAMAASGIGELIRKLLAEKATLHPEQKE